jgi:hypothetical protein
MNINVPVKAGFAIQMFVIDCHMGWLAAPAAGRSSFQLELSPYLTRQPSCHPDIHLLLYTTLLPKLHSSSITLHHG